MALCNSPTIECCAMDNVCVAICSGLLSHSGIHRTHGQFLMPQYCMYTHTEATYMCFISEDFICDHLLWLKYFLAQSQHLFVRKLTDIQAINKRLNNSKLRMICFSKPYLSLEAFFKARACISMCIKQSSILLRVTVYQDF